MLQSKIRQLRTENYKPRTDPTPKAHNNTPKIHYPCHPEEAELLARERLPTKDPCTFRVDIQTGDEGVETNHAGDRRLSVRSPSSIVTNW
jgi:hypothetical protein